MKSRFVRSMSWTCNTASLESPSPDSILYMATCSRFILMASSTPSEEPRYATPLKVSPMLRHERSYFIYKPWFTSLTRRRCSHTAGEPGTVSSSTIWSSTNGAALILCTASDKLEITSNVHQGRATLANSEWRTQNISPSYVSTYLLANSAISISKGMSVSSPIYPGSARFNSTTVCSVVESVSKKDRLHSNCNPIPLWRTVQPSGGTILR
mmetsp:Transcript_14234/g.23261  ORF Transcript_14234/g.23261 Transcript_14234/m.23261 type:complete len:211 (-) Transcript_14234:1125-1757(-)